MSENHSAMLDAADTAVLKRPKSRRKKKERPQKEPLFHVILWNDDVHTYEYVIIMLNTVFGYSFAKGFDLAKEVDRYGRAVVFTSTLQEAETKRDQILAFGPDPLIAGSDGPIIATLEKIPGE
jgi:ATP-dependent Clp protease adaptor protein ClpS